MQCWDQTTWCSNRTIDYAIGVLFAIWYRVRCIALYSLSIHHSTTLIRILKVSLQQLCTALLTEHYNWACRGCCSRTRSALDFPHFGFTHAVCMHMSCDGFEDFIHKSIFKTADISLQFIIFFFLNCGEWQYIFSDNSVNISNHASFSFNINLSFILSLTFSAVEKRSQLIPMAIVFFFFKGS